MTTLRYYDRDDALFVARKEARKYSQVQVMFRSVNGIDQAWYVLPYHDFVPQSEGYDSETLRYILPNGECTKLS